MSKGRKTVRNWKKEPCPICKGLGEGFAFYDDEYSCLASGWFRCDYCRGSGSVNVVIEPEQSKETKK